MTYRENVRNISIFVLVLFCACNRSQAQYVIPLINFSETGQLGINVQLGTNAQQWTYILDTGSAGFFTAKGTTSIWDDTILNPGTTQAFHVSYGTGGLAYSGTMSHTTVTFTTTTGTLAVQNARLGVIKTVEGRPDWDADINNMNGGVPDPIAPESGTSHQFYGTFGAGLYQTQEAGGFANSVIGQVPLAEGLTQGFVIHTGGAASESPTLTIGLTQSMIDAFPILIRMNASTGTLTNDNGTTVKLYPEAQATATYTILKGEVSYQTVADLILDTGGLGTHLSDGANVDVPASLIDGGMLVEGASFGVAIDGTEYPGGDVLAQGLDWKIDPTGNVQFFNRVGVVEGGTGAGSLNSGIALFYNYDVMFDTENGVIGLRPVPEPGVVSLIALAVAGCVVWRRQRGA